MKEAKGLLSQVLAGPVVAVRLGTECHIGIHDTIIFTYPISNVLK